MEKRSSFVPAGIALIATAVSIVLWFMPAPEGAPPEMMRVAAVVLISISLWATSVLPEYFTALIFFFLAMVLTDSGAPTVFSGFHSAAVWMIFGGLIFGASVQETGFGKTLASGLLRFFPRSYLGILAGITVVGAVLGFLIPSNTGRIVIMMPIFMALADQVGFAPGSKGRAGFAMAVAGGSVYPGLAILPAAVPNLGWLGAVESIHGIKVTYGEYLIANFPSLGIVSIIAIPLICRFLFPDRIGEHATNIEAAESSAAQTRLVLVLTAALGLWLTDFAHGISPAWIALGASVLCMMPRVGIVPPSLMVGKVSYAPWFFVAGVIGMGAVVAKAGLGTYISAALFEIVPLTQGHDLLNFAIVSAVGMAMSIVTTVPGQPAIMTTLAADIAASTGWPLMTVLMTQPISWAMSIFAYQFPPIVLAAYLGGISMRRVARLLLSMCALAWLVMMPVQYVWWRLIGYFG
tara:strand:- start:25963 stop:27351 length:1389 start_codon:yes stop_codon:yes gene_type:complete